LQIIDVPLLVCRAHSSWDGSISKRMPLLRVEGVIFTLEAHCQVATAGEAGVREAHCQVDALRRHGRFAHLHDDSCKRRSITFK